MHATTSSAAAPDLASVAFARRIARIRRLRNLSAFGAAFLVVAFLAGSYKPRTLIFGDRFSVGAGNGCISFGLHHDLPADWPTTTSSPAIPALGGWIGFANLFVYRDGSSWRPYHAAGGAAHHLIFPIWQPLAISALVAGLTHGYLRGLRWRDPRLCIGCGHAIVPRAGESACPECGLQQSTSELPRVA